MCMCCNMDKLLCTLYSTQELESWYYTRVWLGRNLQYPKILIYLTSITRKKKTRNINYWFIILITLITSRNLSCEKRNNDTEVEKFLCTTTLDRRSL